MPDFNNILDGQISGTRKTSDGYLVANVLCARTGMQAYAGYEVGKPELQRVRVYRPESSVFSTDSISTYAGKPATNDHPSVPVTSENWKDLAVGSIGNEILREGEFVQVPLVLMDQAAINDVESGKRELSMGYSSRLEFKSGTTSDGEEYDAVMSDMRMNHIAIVDKARAGSRAKIGDSWGASPLTNDNGDYMTIKTRSILVDGLTVETTDSGAQAIEKLQNDKQKLTADAEKLQQAHDAALAQKDSELATKDSEIAELKKQVLSDSDIDARVTARAELITKAQAFAKDADFAGKSDADIKKMTVDSVRGAEFTADKSPAYIDAAFDMLEAPKSGDTFRTAMQSRDTKPPAGDNGQAEYEKRLNDAWKGGTK